MKVDKEDIREAFEKLEREFIERDVDSRLLDYAPGYKEAEEDDRES